MNPKAEKKMFVFTAPSGAGKTTVVKHLLSNYDNLGFSISATTRTKRAGETDGVDYYFLTSEEFKKKIAQNEFVEWEEVYENQFYGTLKSEVERIWDEGKFLVFDIDVRGATNIKKFFGNQCMAVFIRPPSFEVLKQRLIDRNTENEATLKKRIDKVIKELTYEPNFDLVLVNDQLDVTLREAETIVNVFINGVPA
ncbi:MAG: guanylate kinase [Lewinellaceae bacterium]|nr:guanylate kinase [Lewinellaceae bacterium]